MSSDLPDHWKVRIAIKRCGCIHVASKTEPVKTSFGDGTPYVKFEAIDGTEHGDTIGMIDWREVALVSWRFTPAVKGGTK